MSIKQDPKSKLWHYEFTKNKKANYKSGFRTRQQAIEAEIRAKDEIIKTETHPELIHSKSLDNRITLEEACNWYLKTITPEKSDHNDDKFMLNNMMKFFGKTKMIWDISPDDVRALRVDLSNTISRRTKKKLSPQTVNHYHTLLKAMINALIKHDKYDGKNSASKVPLLKLPRHKPRFITPEEEKVIRSEVQSKKELWPYYFVGIHTGMRLGEVSSIRVKDVSILSNTIFLPQTKNGKSRHVPMSPRLKEFIKEQIKGRKQDDLLLGETTHWTVSDWFSKVTKDMGLEKVTFHCLRHTFIQRLLAAGEPIYKVSKLVGHSSVEVTESTYGHLSQQDIEGTLNKIDSLI